MGDVLSPIKFRRNGRKISKQGIKTRRCTAYCRVERPDCWEGSANKETDCKTVWCSFGMSMPKANNSCQISWEYSPCIGYPLNYLFLYGRAIIILNGFRAGRRPALLPLCKDLNYKYKVSSKACQNEVRNCILNFKVILMSYLKIMFSFPCAVFRIWGSLQQGTLSELS